MKKIENQFNKKLLLISAGLVLILGLAACNVSLAGDITPPPGSTLPTLAATEAPAEVSMPGSFDLAAGEAIYANKCVDCHGPLGLGDGSMADSLGVEVPPIGAMGQGYDVSPMEWFSVIRDGRMSQMMPPFSGSLSDADIWDVLGYVYALGSDPSQVTRGEDLYANFCAPCHGIDAQGGAAEGAPSLKDASQMTSLSLSAIVDQIDTGNGDSAHAFGDQFDQEQENALALYVRSLVFGRLDEAGAISASAQPEDQTSTESTPGTEDAVSGTVITGQVTNGSGGELPTGLEVTLQGYTNYTLATEVSAPVQPDGSFRFEGVTMTTDDIYLAMVKYDDMYYQSDFYLATGDDQDVTLDVTIFDTTTDASTLSVYRAHVFIYWLSPELIQVEELVTISNSGDKTVYAAGDNQPVVSFGLPEGAINLSFQSGTIGDPYVSTADGFGDPRPIAPGQTAYEVYFLYQIPYDKAATWTMPINLPTSFLGVFVEGTEMKLESSDLTKLADQEMDSTVYQAFSASDLQVGDLITLDISGKPKLDSTSGGLSTAEILAIVIGSAGLILAILGVWHFLKSKQGSEEDTPGDLIDQIAELDDAFEAGEIDENIYKARRAKLKDQLRDAVEKE